MIGVILSAGQIQYGSIYVFVNISERAKGLWKDSNTYIKQLIK